MKKYLLVLIFLCGCMVGPNYKKKDPSMPANYMEKQTDTNSITSLKDWWKTFRDPLLDDLIERAISNNYSLKIAVEKIEETRAHYRIKRADLWPEIDLTAAAFRETISKNRILSYFFPISSYNTFQIGFDALWEIDIFGRLRREKEAAFCELESSIESMRDVYLTLISDVARYYMDICSVKSIIDLTEKKIKLQKEILKLSTNLKQTGIESKINEEAQRAIVKQEEEKLIFYDTLLNETSYHLAVLLGKYPEEMKEKIKEFISIPPAVNKIDPGIPSTLLRRRPDIRMAERKLAAATAKTAAAIAEYFPVFSLSGASQLETSKISKLFSAKSFQWTLGSFLNWPILNFGRVRSNVDMKRSQQKEALFFYENSILNALKDVESALIAYYNEEQNLKNIEAEAKAFSTIALLEKNKYRNGIINFSRYLEAEKISIDSRIKEIESKRALAHNLIALYKALGGGDWQ